MCNAHCFYFGDGQYKEREMAPWANEPHVELVITGTSTVFEGVRDYYVVGPEVKKADAFFGAKVEIRGRIWEAELHLAGSSGRVIKRCFVELQSVSAVE